MRLIDVEKAWKKAQRIYSDPVLLHAIKNTLDDTETEEAAPAVHGEWVKFTRSSLIAFKAGTPVWADRAVYRCDHCHFGTIAKHNYCPRCGVRMDGDGNA
jgi:hypothetical protein